MSQVDVIMRVVQEVISASHQCRTAQDRGDDWENFADERKHYAAKLCALQDMVQLLVDESVSAQQQEPVAWKHPITDDVFSTYGMAKKSCGVEQEPVALYESFLGGTQRKPTAWWIPTIAHPDMVSLVRWSDMCEPLYTSPPVSKPWVGLDDTDLEVCDTDGRLLARYWERVLREKNTS